MDLWTTKSRIRKQWFYSWLVVTVLKLLGMPQALTRQVGVIHFLRAGYPMKQLPMGVVVPINLYDFRKKVVAEAHYLLSDKLVERMRKEMDGSWEPELSREYGNRVQLEIFEVLVREGYNRYLVAATWQRARGMRSEILLGRIVDTFS